MSHGCSLGRVLLVVAVVAGCGPGEPPASEESFVIVSVEPLGLLPRSDWIEGRDGGSSGLAFGRSIWVYGDTVLTRPDETGTQWHTNSFDIADPATWRVELQTPTDSVGAPAFFIPLTEEEREWNERHGPEECDEPPCGVSWALWPGPPLFDAERGRAWVLYGLYNDAQPSGIGIASWDSLDAPVERLRVGDSWLLFPKPEPEWANAPIVVDEHLYAFGCVLDFFAHWCSLGRAPLAGVDDPAAWTFFDGAAWSADMARAQLLFEGAPIMHASFNLALERYLAVYSRPFDHAVVGRIAERLEGPWSRPITLFEAPGPAPYDVVHHPELEEEGGAVQYITYSQPRDDGSWFGSDHHLWRVRIAGEP